MSDIPLLRFSDRVWELNRPYIMGIINLTVDSFYPASRILEEKTFALRLEKVAPYMDILDLGAESTRPGSNPVTAEEELYQLLPKLEYVKKHFPKLKVSIDTSKSEVAQKCIDTGADLINDISAGENFEGEIFKICASNQIPLVLMHKRGVPKTMQNNIFYQDVVDEVYNYLNDRVNLAQEYGLASDKLLIDVGIGFGKELKHNLDLLRALPKFKNIGTGILIGASRKSMLGEITDQPVENRLAGSIAIHLAALKHTCHIIRCHDVREMWDAIQVFFSVMKYQEV